MAPYCQPVLIYNPTAGKLHRDPARLQRTLDALAKGGIAPRLLPTSAPGQAAEMARMAIQDGADLVLVLGGDGTINEALQGVANTGVAFGVLPGGTANVLAMELGLGSNPETAAARLVESRPTEIALGKISGGTAASRYFTMMCGLGLDAAIIDQVSPKLKAMAGKFAYWAAGFSQVTTPVKNFEITIDGQTHRCGFALISRVRNYGGDLEIASYASLRRDQFHAVWLQGTFPLRYTTYTLAATFRQALRMPGAHHALTHSVELLDPAPAQIDGERVGSGPLKVEIIPGALNLLIPGTYK